MATKELINPNGVLIKPKSKAHMKELLNKVGGWVEDPETGELVNRGGFRIATDEEIVTHRKTWAAKSKRMEQQELQAKKNNAQIVMMAPDPGTLDRLIDQREERRKAGKASEEATVMPSEVPPAEPPKKTRKKKAETPVEP